MGLAIRELRFTDCNITDEHLARMGWLSHLDNLSIGGGTVTAAGVANLAGGTIKSLRLAYMTSIDDRIFEAVSKLTKLSQLLLMDTSVTGSGIGLLKELPLADLEVPECSLFGDEGLDELANPSLSSLAVYGTRVTKKGLLALNRQRLPKLQWISVFASVGMDPDEMASFEAAMPGCFIDFVEPEGEEND